MKSPAEEQGSKAEARSQAVSFTSEHLPGEALFIVPDGLAGKALLREGVSRGAIYSAGEIALLEAAQPGEADVAVVMRAKLIFAGVIVHAGKPEPEGESVAGPIAIR